MIPGFPGGSAVKNPPTNAGDTSLIPGLGRLLEKEMATHSSILASLIPGLGRLLEKEMATHSSILACEMPRTLEPGGLQSMGSQKSWTQLSD